MAAKKRPSKYCLMRGKQKVSCHKFKRNANAALSREKKRLKRLEKKMIKDSKASTKRTVRKKWLPMLKIVPVK